MAAHDSSQPGSEGMPLRVAIIGSGPSGFYAADALLKSDLAVQVAMIEKLPAPYGLVRFGVAPDHSKIRSVINVYEKVAASGQFSYWGNVEVGRDVTVDELYEHFDALIFAFGAATDRKLGIPGEDLQRSYTATSFCAWYNGHPEFRDCDFDLSHETAVVIGQGNVAMDVARILAMPVDDLQTTDMASHAVQTLRQSKVRQIHVVGRRGPAQAKFTPKEVSELGEIRDCDVVIDPGDLELSETDQAELALPDRKSNQRNMEILRQFAERPTGQASRRIVLRFMLSPVELRGEGGVRQAVFQKNQLVGEPGHQRAEGTGQTLTMDCQLFFRSVGYRGVRLPGVPFDDKRSVIPNDCGRVKGAQAMYCTGWIKRGASGLIGTNKADSQETVEQLLADAPQLTPASQRDNEALRRRLAERGVRAISFEDWKQIDAAEIERGRAQGKPRENFTTVDQMLAVLD